MPYSGVHSEDRGGVLGLVSRGSCCLSCGVLDLGLNRGGQNTGNSRAQESNYFIISSRKNEIAGDMYRQHSNK